MHRFLQSLYTDHQNILKLLVLFEREIKEFENAGNPDYTILETGTEYCAEYMDEVHHRKEEQMLDQLRKKDPEAAAKVSELTQQHHELEHLTHQLVAAITAVHDDAFVKREDLVLAAQRWVQAYQDHLRWEEKYLFNVARAELSDADWDAAQAQWEHVVNPLHENAKDERFRQLAAAVAQVTA